MKSSEHTPGVDENGRPEPGLPEIEDAAELLAADIETPTVLIEDLLHQGSKFSLTGGSKSFKTFTLLDIAISVATGADWLGHPTTPGKVLYINLEIQRPFFQRRLRAILSARKIKLEEGQLDAWNLRGYAADFSNLKPQILERIKNEGYVLIILDPIYKVYGKRCENATEDMADLMNELENVALKSDAAVGFGAHHSKGNQAGKESIDRVSGSGVFARDPDTILDIAPHDEEDAFVVTPTLRNFKPIEPFCITWKFPLMELAPDLNPAKLKQPGRTSFKVEPEDEVVRLLFPSKWPRLSPRKGLLSSGELAEKFDEKDFQKSKLTIIRSRLAEQGRIGIIDGLARNEILAGLPKAVEAFKKYQTIQKAA